MIGTENIFAHLLAIIIANSSTVASPSVDQKGRCVLIGEELRNTLPEVDLLKGIFPKFRSVRKEVLLLHVAVQRILVNLHQLLLVVVLQQRLGIGIDLRCISVEDDLA